MPELFDTIKDKVTDNMPDFSALGDRAAEIGSKAGDLAKVVGGKIKDNPEYLTTPLGVFIAHMLQDPEARSIAGYASGGLAGFGAGKVLGSAIGSTWPGEPPRKSLRDRFNSSEIDRAASTGIGAAANVAGGALKGTLRQFVRHPFLGTILMGLLASKTQMGRNAIGAGINYAAKNSPKLQKIIEVLKGTPVVK